ncbi:MAG: penicillin-binding protein 1A, partial [Pseudobdellovibrionaceae bacterium]
AAERRILVPYNKIPQKLVQAFLAAEDDKFFEHKGINPTAIMRAMLANMKAGRTVQGGSTITQQVTKTLLLSDERTYTRKLREALLAYKIEQNLSKEDILYLYLNQIYLGESAHGVKVAAETYFKKTLDQLTLPEMAILAALPQAPSRDNPVKKPRNSKERQIYVLNRMAEVGYITREEADAAKKQPVTVHLKVNYDEFAPFFTETVRIMLAKLLGGKKVSEQGLRIHTSLDLKKQLAAQESLRAGLRELDKRQGYRGPLKNISNSDEVAEFLLKNRNKMIVETNPIIVIQPDGSVDEPGPLDLKKVFKDKAGAQTPLPPYAKVGDRVQAIVTKVDDAVGLATIRFGETQGLIDLETMTWARKPDPEVIAETVKVKKVSEALKQGDVIQVTIVGAMAKMSERMTKQIAALKKKDKKATPPELPDFRYFVDVELDQDPLVQGALISYDQKNQDLIAMVGGYNFEESKYNRTIQAARQTGSAFKAIIYAAALDKGYTPATPVIDAPLVYQEQAEEKEGQQEDKTWRPANHDRNYSGDILFRNALIKSLNVPTVKITEDISVQWASDYARRLGIFSSLNMDFTLGLGSSGVTLYEITRAFAQFGRLGKRLNPVIIHRVESAKGELLAENVTMDSRFAEQISPIQTKFEERRKAYLEQRAQAVVQGDETPAPPSKEPPIFFEDPDQLMKPTTAYITTSLLKAVVEEPGGTGGRARAVGREVAGKTGTTSGYFDAWFVGYSPQISTGVWVGFDKEKTIGRGEVGGKSALPIWTDYMKAAHEGLPDMTFPVPPGIVFANIDNETGQLASSGTKKVVRQAFEEGTEPTGTKNKKEEESDFYKQDLNE